MLFFFAGAGSSLGAAIRSVGAGGTGGGGYPACWVSATGGYGGLSRGVLRRLGRIAGVYPLGRALSGRWPERTLIRRDEPHAAGPRSVVLAGSSPNRFCPIATSKVGLVAQHRDAVAGLGDLVDVDVGDHEFRLAAGRRDHFAQR